MESTTEHISKEKEKMNKYTIQIQSQDPLDSSSASSLSVFAEHSESNNGPLRAAEISTDSPKCEDYVERASMDEALKSEKAFIEFVMSFPSKDSSEHHRSVDSMSTKSKSPTAGSATTKVGLDHLDNLCKLMEQLSELRDNNYKLQRRVQYLEDLKTLHDMHKEITEGEQYCSEDALSSESRPYELQKSATETHVGKKEEEHAITNRSASKYLSRRSRHQQDGGLRRERSKSVGHEDLGEDTKSKRLFPKWSKVKEAFGWESDRKESVKVKEERNLLNSSRRRSDDSRQSHRHPGSPTWYQDSASLHSSLEDVNEEFDDGRWKRASVASEKYGVSLDIPSDGLRRQKSAPSPGSDKTHLYRDVTEIKTKCATIERDSCKGQDFSKFDKEDAKRGKGPWGRVKTIIEKRRDSLKRRSLRRDYSTGDFETSMNKNSLTCTEAVDFKNYNEFLESSVKQGLMEETTKKKRSKPGPIVFDPEDYTCPRTPSSSPTFHRKSTWGKVKKVLKGKKEEDRDPMSISTPASPDSQQDIKFTFDVIDELSRGVDDDTKISRVGSDVCVHQMEPGIPSSELMLQLQRNLSEDFHRKIQEWERIRGMGNVSCSPQWDRKPSSDISRSRKKSERDDKNIKHKIKDLAWLEKELQKIEKEKQRLSKERQKYEERALRLEKLRETVLTANNSNKGEVLVKTSAGEFRFEGISDAFTKKLYEWETKRGLGPELSTIALLDSSRLVAQPAMSQKNGLQRVLSRSESSIADIGQPSHNSSNSLPSVKLADNLEIDRQNHHSRANSEPDLSSLVAFKIGPNISVTTLARCSDNKIESKDLDETAKPNEDSENEKQRKNSETYYGLLEENVILLEQLKDKEEICRRLEKELEILDQKVDVMHARHMQETERYRSKLWEIHRQGATSTDMVYCRQTMEQLKMRIDTLERCTEKLRSDRETIEDSFRYHSKEQETMTLDLLEKMRELKAVGKSKAENETNTKKSTCMETDTIERLQGLSVLLMKQTQELETTLSEKTRQICQLKWELLHRDLSTVKLQTELHTHTAHKKRSKYAHWRSRSSEEASAPTVSEMPDSGDSLTLVTDVYNCGAPTKEFRTGHLANTVQQLNKEVMKLTSNADCLEYDDLIKSAPITTKTAEVPIIRKCHQPSDINECKKITVRRSSADNLNLVPAHDNRNGNSSSSHSDDSSDEYYTKVSWRSGAKSNLQNSDSERLLMSYGENPPRCSSQRRKKLQKLSKYSSSNCRKRSNTFHTNRDLVKPIITETGPQKCQSFRITRKQIEESVRDKPIDINLIRNLSIRMRNQTRMIEAMNRCPIAKEECLSRNNIDSKTLEHMILREVASDSKIPTLLQLQYREQKELPDINLSYCPNRSMSDRHKNETAAQKREHIQKKRSKKRLKSPDSLKQGTDPALKANINSNSQNERFKDQSSLSTRELGCEDSLSDNPIPHTEVPTITIQLPKRKLKKASYSIDRTTANEEQSFTIIMPKKRSLSSEQDSSSVSESSPRLPHSIESCYKSDSVKQSNSSEQSLTDSHSTLPSSKLTDKTNGKIHLLKLVSLSKFDSPFNNGSEIRLHDSTDSDLNSHRKRKAEQSSADNSPITDNGEINFISIKDRQLQQSSSHDFSSRFENKAPFKSAYVKSPSAPQLDWRRICAKKISKSGAPNVKTLIEKYNQKVIESQVYKSPYSSNINSPVTNRKTSTPVQPCCSPISDSVHFHFSTPNTPTIGESLNTPPIFKASNSDLGSKSPPSSPLAIARTEELKKAKENFISSQTSLTLPTKICMDNFSRSVSNDDSPKSESSVENRQSPKTNQQELSQRNKQEEDYVSSSSMDSMSLVMLRAGENCQESRMPKRNLDAHKSDTQGDKEHSLKPSKSLSSSSLFKSVLNHDFKMPSSLLRLKKSKRKKDMGAVSQLCRQSLLLTCEDSSILPGQASHKSCPSSPELKSKSTGKMTWFQRNIFKHK